MSQERGQARLPNPELLYLAYDPVLKGIQSIKATRVGSARGREGGLAPAALSDAVGCLRKPEEVLARLLSNKA